MLCKLSAERVEPVEAGYSKQAEMDDLALDIGLLSLMLSFASFMNLSSAADIARPHIAEQLLSDLLYV